MDKHGKHGKASVHQGTSPNFQGGLPAPGGYRDVVWSVLFYLHLACLVGLFAIGVDRANNDKHHMIALGVGAGEGEGGGVVFTQAFVYEVMGTMFLSIVGAIMMGGFFLYVTSRYPRQVIVGSIVASMLAWFLYGLAFFVAAKKAGGSVAPAVIFILMGLLMCIFYFVWRNRIPFAAALLGTSAKVVRAYNGMIISAFLSILVVIAYLSLWASTLSLQIRHMSYEDQATGADKTAIWFLVFSFYWSSQVIQNTLFCTLAGTTATWYFLGGDNQAVGPNPTVKSFRRAATTSFGSICLGSLIVALIQTVRAMVRSLQNKRNALLICLIECLLSCIEAIIRYFNSYAFCQVAIYGKSYCESARETYEMFTRVGLWAVINDVIVHRVLSLCVFAGALLTATFGAVCGYIIIQSSSVMGSGLSAGALGAIVGSLTGFFAGLFILSQIVSVYNAAIHTLFVCYAMDPHALERNDRELYAEFQATSTLV